MQVFFFIPPSYWFVFQNEINEDQNIWYSIYDMEH